MKANLKIIASATAALIVASAALPAFAADMIEQAPEPAPVEIVPTESTGWAGPYGGVYGQWNRARTQSSSAGQVNPDGFGGGVFAGVQGQAGQFVYGAEGDVGYNGASDGNAVIHSRTGTEGSLRARLGYAVNDRVLLYGTGGAAAASVKVSDAVTSDKNTMLGYTAGVGVDAKLTDNVFGRVEYRYTDLGSKNFNVAGGQNVDQDSNAIKLGVGLKF